MSNSEEKVDSTPAAKWRVNGEEDPHAGHYDGERAKLTLGYFTDDEIANAVFMNYDQWPSAEQIIAKKAKPPIVYVTAAKERIRWLSRALEKELAAKKQLEDVIKEQRSVNNQTAEVAKNALMENSQLKAITILHSILLNNAAKVISDSRTDIADKESANTSLLQDISEWLLQFEDCKKDVMISGGSQGDPKADQKNFIAGMEYLMNYFNALDKTFSMNMEAVTGSISRAIQAQKKVLNLISEEQEIANGEPHH